MCSYDLYGYAYTVDLENFGVKKLRKTQTSTKLKHKRLFYYDNFTFEYLVHAYSFHSTHSCTSNVCDNVYEAQTCISLY